MHQSVLQFITEMLPREEVQGRFVLEAGALDVNGSPRTAILGHDPGVYIGVDLQPGPGVDVVADAKDLPVLYPGGADIVVAASMLEHAPGWQAALAGLVGVVKPGGTLLVTVPSPGFGYHGHPGDYWRFSVDDLRAIAVAAGLTVLDLREDSQVEGAFLKASKPAGWAEPAGMRAGWEALGDLGLWYPAYQARAAVWSDIQGHLPYLYETVRSYPDPVVIELGVREGNSTIALLAATCSGGHLWSADVLPPAVPNDWREDARWHFLLADDLSPQALAWAPPVCDVLFIDTSHTYEQTLAELEAYAPRVAPGGTVLLHDTQFQEDGPTDRDVARALDTWCAANDRSWENRPGSYGLGIIRMTGENRVGRSHLGN